MKILNTLHLGTILVFTLTLASCDTGSPPAGGNGNTSAVDAVNSPDPFLNGKAAYEKVCAGCHENGANGAPRSDDPTAWANRSSLWQAVLSEHAKMGYIDMPAKGGDDSMSDPEIEAATDYMMTLAFPDRFPRD